MYQVGETYFSNYWRKKYKVIAVKGPCVTVLWEDAVQPVTHLTPQDPRDRFVAVVHQDGADFYNDTHLHLYRAPFKVLDFDLYAAQKAREHFEYFAQMMRWMYSYEA